MVNIHKKSYEKSEVKTSQNIIPEKDMIDSQVIDEPKKKSSYSGSTISHSVASLDKKASRNNLLTII